jgi:prefoldin alpha subunit
MDQQAIMQATMLEQQSREIEQNLELVETQITELNQMLETLFSLDKSNENSLYSSLGKGIFLKTALEDKKLLVQVGAGIAVKKTPQEARKTIEEQITRFQEAKTHLSSQRELVHNQLHYLIKEIENQKTKQQ